MAYLMKVTGYLIIWRYIPGLTEALPWQRLLERQIEHWLRWASTARFSKQEDKRKAPLTRPIRHTVPHKGVIRCGDCSLTVMGITASEHVETPPALLGWEN